MQPSIDRPTEDRTRVVRRYGPIAVLVVTAAIVAIIVASSGSGGSKKVATAPSTTVAPGPAASPTGALSFSEAKKQGKTIDFGPTCDPATGRLAIPDYFAPECYAPVADNRGATARGVTANAINVVLYQSQPNDPVIKFIEGDIAVTDTTAQTEETYRGYIKLFEHFANTYGRKVNLEVLNASGIATDEVAARADAVKAATELNAFAVWGRP